MSRDSGYSNSHIYLSFASKRPASLTETFCAILEIGMKRIENILRETKK